TENGRRPAVPVRCAGKGASARNRRARREGVLARAAGFHRRPLLPLPDELPPAGVERRSGGERADSVPVAGPRPDAAAAGAGFPPAHRERRGLLRAQPGPGRRARPRVGRARGAAGALPARRVRRRGLPAAGRRPRRRGTGPCDRGAEEVRGDASSARSPTLAGCAPADGAGRDEPGMRRSGGRAAAAGSNGPSGTRGETRCRAFEEWAGRGRGPPAPRIVKFTPLKRAKYTFARAANTQKLPTGYEPKPDLTAKLRSRRHRRRCAPPLLRFALRIAGAHRRRLCRRYVLQPPLIAAAAAAALRRFCASPCASPPLRSAAAAFAAAAFSQPPLIDAAFAAAAFCSRPSSPPGAAALRRRCLCRRCVFAAAAHRRRRSVSQPPLIAATAAFAAAAFCSRPPHHRR
ncbi:MAG: hypothetical protein BJ554DRAFT_3468, partial [Olpidium bornovanus]